MKELNDMGFGRYCDGWFREKINDVSTTDFFKSYDCCDRCFRLAIALRGCELGGQEIHPSVSISTLEDDGYADDWKIRDFIEDMEKFQRELRKDLKQLRKLGVIS